MKRIRLTESDIHRIVKESVQRVLNEMDDFVYDVSDYRDLGTTLGIEGFSELNRLFGQLKRYVGSVSDDFGFLHAEDWSSFIDMLKECPRRMLFKTTQKGNADKTAESALKELVFKTSKIEYPDLWTSSNSSFADKAKSIKKTLKTAYKFYSDFIDYLVSAHDNPSMKRQDMDVDWKKFDKTRASFLDRSKKDAEFGRSVRAFKNAGFSNNFKRGALSRADIVANPEGDGNQEYHNALIGKE